MTTPEQPEREPTLIGSVQRALRLVDIVANESRPVPVKVIAARAGLTTGTAYNLVRTLVHEGYLAAEPDGLVLGARFPAFDAESGPRGVFLARVRRALNETTGELGATAYLSRYTDGEVHLIDIVDGARSPRVELWVGLHDSAHATALGKQILADLPPVDRLDYLSRHPLSELTQHTISDRRTLLGQLETPRPWTVDREEYAIGFTCVAVPVSAPDVTASLAVSLPSSTSPERAQQVIARLRRVSVNLSLQLGADRFGQFTI